MKKITLESEGRRLVGAVAKAGTTTWFSFGGEVWTKEEGRSKRGSSMGAALDPSRVQSPMPGKIIKVMVELGEQVSAGAIVVVMEAMKMEYTLKASAAGQVKSISCRSGDQVNLGAVLVELEVSK